MSSPQQGADISESAAEGAASPPTARQYLPEALGRQDVSTADERDRGERDDGLTSAERDELRELRTRVKRLAQERDILKRATALFARETETR